MKRWASCVGLPVILTQFWKKHMWLQSDVKDICSEKTLPNLLPWEIYCGLEYRFSVCSPHSWPLAIWWNNQLNCIEHQSNPLHLSVFIYTSTLMWMWKPHIIFHKDTCPDWFGSLCLSLSFFYFLFFTASFLGVVGVWELWRSRVWQAELWSGEVFTLFLQKPDATLDLKSGHPAVNCDCCSAIWEDFEGGDTGVIIDSFRSVFKNLDNFSWFYALCLKSFSLVLKCSTVDLVHFCCCCCVSLDVFCFF